MDKDLLMFRGLLMDDHSKKVLSSVMHMSDLRECNIAYHSQLTDAKREAIRETAMIYLITPQKEQNIQILIEDMNENMYDYVFLDFTGPVSNTIL